MTGRVRAGVSGWTYPHWRGDFYPPGLPQRLELAYAAQRMSAIELNGSFYSLQLPASYLRWYDQVGEDVELAVKGSRFITHMKKLQDVEAPLANFFASGVLGLGDRLGPVLWQLPEVLRFDADRLTSFLRLLPRTTREAAELAQLHDDRIDETQVMVEVDVDRPLRHVLEPRSASFATAEAMEVLREHDVACVVADSAGRWPQLWEDTGPVRYVRLHGHTELYTSGYTAGELDVWAERCLAWSARKDVYVFFDNDARGRAPWDATALLERLGQAVHAPRANRDPGTTRGAALDG